MSKEIKGVYYASMDVEQTDWGEELLPNPAQNLQWGWTVFMKDLWFIKVLFCLQSLVMILSAAGELHR